MKKFRNRYYRISGKGLKLSGEEKIRICLLADLHGVEIGKKNELLLKEIRLCRPDLILSVGDLCLRRGQETIETAEHVLKECRKIAPVYASMGNHESGIANSESLKNTFQTSIERMKAENIQVLRNERVTAVVHNQRIELDGLELSERFFGRGILPKISSGEIEKLLGVSGEQSSYRILLAHSPAYAESYFDTGADLILSGHYHGGVLRLSEHQGAIAPNLMPFPKHCCGDFHQGHQTMIVSGGLGEHSIPLRIHNPRELITIDIFGGVQDGTGY